MSKALTKTWLHEIDGQTLAQGEGKGVQEGRPGLILVAVFGVTNAVWLEPKLAR